MKRSYLHFLNSYPTKIEQQLLNASIQEMSFDSFNIDLDDKFLNRNVYETIESIFITGRLRSIQPNIFGLFNDLNYIQMGPDCFRLLISRYCSVCG